MAISWTNANTTGTAVTAAWANESRAGITIADQIVTTDGSGGSGTTVTLTLPTGITISDVDDYMVLFGWQEDPGSLQGDVYAVKTTSNFVVKNTGSGTGKKIAVRAVLYRGS